MFTFFDDLLDDVVDGFQEGILGEFAARMFTSALGHRCCVMRVVENCADRHAAVRQVPTALRMCNAGAWLQAISRVIPASLTSKQPPSYSLETARGRFPAVPCGW